MFDAHRIAVDFSAAAPRYDAHAGLQQWVLKKLTSQLQPYLVPGARVLDAGCGTGILKSLLGHAEVIGLDIAPAMCAQARQAGVMAVNGAMEALPFKDESFDAAVSSLALQWLADSRIAIDEMRRALKPGGVLALATFGEGTLQELKASFAALDGLPHVSSFAPAGVFDRQETVTQYVPNVTTLMQWLKAIGARNKLAGRGRALMTPRQLGRIEAYYKERFGTDHGLPVTWNILTSVTVKP